MEASSLAPGVQSSVTPTLTATTSTTAPSSITTTTAAATNAATTTTTTATTNAASTNAATTTTTTTTNNNNNNSNNGTTAPQRDPPKNLRGLNKPKCSKCGNVARSRCPYQSCKSCCAKAQNPCHIHVLKANATFPDKTPSSSSPLFDQQSTDVSSTGASMRVSSLRQLSQFSGAQIPPRARRPLTRKDAAAINQWRFSKLKEYQDRYTEAQNEAFNRYMQNVSFLEEAFSISSSLEGLTPDRPTTTSISREDNTQRMILDLKAKLRSNPRRADAFRQRIQGTVDRGMRKLQNWELNDEQGSADANDQDGLKELKRPRKAKNWRIERALAVNDLIDKLNKARNEEDLQSCLQIKSKLFNRDGKACSADDKDLETSKEQVLGDLSTPRHGNNYLPPRLCGTVEVNQEILRTIDMHFSSLDMVEDL